MNKPIQPIRQLFRQFFRQTSALLILLVTLTALAAVAIAENQVPDEQTDQKVLRTRLLEHRNAEADRKEKYAKALLAANDEKTANQEMYDVIHYDLGLTITPSNSQLAGVVTTTAEVIGGPINTFELHLASHMNVAEVALGGTVTSFSRSGSILTVNLDRTYVIAETVEVAVTYSGNPASESFGWDAHDGQSMIWTLSEPFGARNWWPCKDLNTDKADSVDICVTVPSSLIVASNGLLVSKNVEGANTTYNWHTNYPTATYLVSLAIHPYVEFSHWYTPLAGGDPMEVQYFVYSDHYNLVQANYALTVPMISAFANGFGEYPFVDEKYGHAEFTWGGGMEHQTITSMGGYAEDLISHELAHQWWGDMITCADFGHIWLNEGFATWSEAYWAEQNTGFELYQEYMEIAAYQGPGTIFVEDPLNDVIFSGDLSYNKASWVVHMLRGVLGDENFFAGLELYRTNYEYSSATTEQLQADLESVSGIDLTAFFQQWIYGEYFPIYQSFWTLGPAEGQISVVINQSQTNADVFTMPIQLRVTTNTGSSIITVQNNQAEQSYVLDVDGTVISVDLDPDNWILKRIEDPLVDPSFSEGILVVNGVEWGTYGTEITSAYTDSIFWGDNDIDFWDCFDEPSGGYPTNLPAPIGHGSVPVNTLGNYSTVVWVGNNYQGDLARWSQTQIQAYVEAGGNVLLMTRYSHRFLDDGLLGILGATPAESDSPLSSCVATASGLVNIPFVGSQTLNDVFTTTVGALSQILFTDNSGFSGVRATGVMGTVGTVGPYRPTAGRLVVLSGRPYRMDHTALRTNVETILETYLGEPYDSTTGVEDNTPEVVGPVATLGQNFPNPFNPKTVIPFSIKQSGRVELSIFDARGRLVKQLVNNQYIAGDHAVNWDGSDKSGRSVASGNYYARLKTNGVKQQSRALVLIR